MPAIKTAIRRQKYHEIDRIELKGSRIAARATSRIRAKVLQAYKDKTNYNPTDDIIKDVILPLIAASIVSDLKGRKRSFIAADKSFDVKPTLELGPRKKQDESLLSKTKKEIYQHTRRIFKLPIKKTAKNIGFKITIEGLPKELQDKYKKGKKLYKEGKKTKAAIGSIPEGHQVGKTRRIEKVPDKPVKYTAKRKRYTDHLRDEHKRVVQEIKDKIKFERKYIYDELVRQVRTIIKDVGKIAIKTVDWQEVLRRLVNQESFLDNVQDFLKRDERGNIVTEIKISEKTGKKKYRTLEDEKAHFLEKLVNKAKRKIRDKKERLKTEIKIKIGKEAFRAGNKYILKPVKKSIEQKISEKFFGEPRSSGSHRQYRSQYYYIAKSLQELERGQKRRRKYETAKRILGAAGGIADLVGFLSSYNAKDLFVFLTEMGGATYFPETYKLGGVIKAANYVSTVAHTLEDEIDDYTKYGELSKKYRENRVKEYQIKHILRLIQELQTIKQLFSRYHPPIYNILQNVGQKTNDNLRETINNLILSGENEKEATKILIEAFKANGLDTSNPYKIETIFRTQSALAYSAGRYQADQHPAIQEILWGYKYVTVGDSRVRPQHRILDGVTLPKDDPFWNYFWPPNSWNCRCSVISLFEETKIVLPPPEFKGLEGIDKDFTFNPGLLFTEAYAKLAGT